MAFQLKREESVRKAVKRLGRKAIRQGRAGLKRSNRLDGVHEARKRIKQLRALLRLVRAAIPRSVYRGFSARLRAAAGHLAASRDAQVKVEALAALSAHFQTRLSPNSFSRIKQILSQECRRRRTALSVDRAPKKVRCALKKLSREIPSLKLRSSGWAALGSGLKRSYRDGRRCFRLAGKTGAPDHFHQWRKRAKDLYHQIGLLRPIGPEQMGAAHAELDALGQCLGDDHDLFLLTEPTAMEQFKKLAPREAETLQRLVTRRQTELRAQALARGARFYQEKPSGFCQRLQRDWTRWRRPTGAVAPAC